MIFEETIKTRVAFRLSIYSKFLSQVLPSWTMQLLQVLVEHVNFTQANAWTSMSWTISSSDNVSVREPKQLTLSRLTRTVKWRNEVVEVHEIDQQSLYHQNICSLNSSLESASLFSRTQACTFSSNNHHLITDPEAMEVSWQEMRKNRNSNRLDSSGVSFLMTRVKGSYCLAMSWGG